MEGFRRRLRKAVLRIPWLRRWFYVPVYLAGLFPSVDGLHGSGTRVGLYDRESDETVFEGLGLGYRFVVNDDGVVTDLMVTHVSGDYRYARQQ